MIDSKSLALDLPVEQRFYVQMKLIRLAEEKLLALFSDNELSGTTHTCLGQEADAVGIINALDRNIDEIWSNHRGHGHYLAYCGKLPELFAEIMGKATGICGGRGGSQHLCYGNFYTNGIQGGGTPIATGAAMALKGTKAIVVSFIGDGTIGSGLVYESLNLAALWSLPILFVVEDNGIAQTTPRDHTISGSILDRAKPFGIQTYYYHGTNVMEINDIAAKAVADVRTNQRPGWLVIQTVRLGPHSKGDDTRTKKELQTLQQQDPIILHRNQFKLSTAELDHRCQTLVEDALVFARESQTACGL